MKKLAYVLMFFSLLVLVLSAVVFIISNKVIQTENFYTSVNVTHTGGGFDINGSALIFGEISYGSSSRKILFKNEYPFPIVSEIDIEGDIAPLVNFDNNVEFEAGEYKEIPLTVSASPDVKRGFYSGEVIFKIKPA